MKQEQIKHIVFIEVVNIDIDIKKENVALLKSKLLGLSKFIDKIIELEVGDNFSTRSSFDIALSVVFVNEEDLNEYRRHPKHVEVLEFMKTLVLKTTVVDYYF